MKKFLKYVIDEQPILIILLILGLLTTNICMYFSCYEVPMHYKVDTFYRGEPAVVSYSTLVMDQRFQLKIVRIQTPTKRIVLGSNSFSKKHFSIVIIGNDGEALEKQRVMDDEELTEFKKFTS